VFDDFLLLSAVIQDQFHMEALMKKIKIKSIGAVINFSFNGVWITKSMKRRWGGNSPLAISKFAGLGSGGSPGHSFPTAHPHKLFPSALTDHICKKTHRWSNRGVSTTLLQM
jgi:hypothetical protein